MDIKQKKSILSATFKAFALFAILSIGWVAYFGVYSLIKNLGIFWLNIALLAVDLFILISYFSLIAKMKKLKNLYSSAKLLFFVLFATFSGIVAGIFTMYYTGFIVPIDYYLTIAICVFAEILLLFMFFTALSLIKLHKNTTIIIDSTTEVPNYDDELMLKKQRNELNRKLEMKKVSDEIDEMKKLLGE